MPPARHRWHRVYYIYEEIANILSNDAMFNIIVASHVSGRVTNALNPIMTSWDAYFLHKTGVRFHSLAEKSDTFNLRADRKLRADVERICNSSTEFAIADETDPNIFPVVGSVPNSGESEEHSEHTGHRSNSIVAIGSLPMTPSQSVHLIYRSCRKLCRLECYPAPASVSPVKSSMSLSVFQIVPPMPLNFPMGVDFASSTTLTRTLIR